MPDASYVAGQAPEFNHNFRAVEVEGRNELGMTPEQMGTYTMGEALSRMGEQGGPPGIFGTLFKKAGQQMRDSVDTSMDLLVINTIPALNGLLNLPAAAVCLRWLVVARFPR
jgi:hypothetical protein